MQPQSMTHKILARAAGKSFVSSGDVVEAGAKNGIMELSDRALIYLSQITDADFKEVRRDDDFQYCQHIAYGAETFRPVVAYPHRPDNIRSIEEAKGDSIRLDQVYIGACTGVKIEDIQVATEALKGRKVARGVRLIVVPGSMKVYRQTFLSYCLHSGDV